MTKKLTKKLDCNSLSNLGGRNKLFLFCDKKGTSEMWWIIAAAIIALIAVIFIVVWFTRSGGTLFDNLDNTIIGLKDYDKDGTSDLLDKCPCDPNLQKLELGQTCSGLQKSECEAELKKQK